MSPACSVSGHRDEPREIRVASGGFHVRNEVDPATVRIVPDPVTGEVLRVEPLQPWDAELDWAS